MARTLFAKIALYSVAAAAGTYFCVLGLARHEILASKAASHAGIYAAYLQGVTEAKSADETKASPYWGALDDLREHYAESRLSVAIAGSPQAKNDTHAFEALMRHPRNWEYSERRGGVIRSYFSLPTKNLAAFVATSNVQLDLDLWKKAAAIPAGVVFALIFAAALYFAPHENAERTASRPAATDQEISQRLAAMNAVVSEFGIVLAEVSAALKAIEASGDLRPIDDLAAQIRLLAVNGLIETSRPTPPSARAFHDLLTEINQLALRARDAVAVATLATGGSAGGATSPAAQAKRRIAELQALLSGSAADAPLESSSGSASAASFRRVG